MKIEIWSDVVCPWCYIGKRRFERALAGFEHRDDVSVLWRSFELDPAASASANGDPVDRLAAKYRMSRADALAAQSRITSVAATEGLEFHLERARSGNTIDAHRLLHLAQTTGRQDELKERLMAAYFSEGAAIGEPDVLVQEATAVGLEETAVRDVLASDAYAREVRHDEQEARAIGISGVPFFVVDRAYGISGAQPSEVILAALEKAWADSHPLQMVGSIRGGAGAGCSDDGCALPTG